ncbi:MAG TPA: single-stranded DNA-binding protein [bacterium]|nr:single-stranded DNA-binding protein [bacterium]
MGSLNKAMIIGRLGKDPEVRYTQGGQAVASFSVATDHKWTNKSGEKQEKTEWHRIKAWGKLAELAGEYLSKGRQVYVEGRIETSEYTDKDGVKKYSTEINAQEIQFLDSKGEGAGRGAGGGSMARRGNDEGGGSGGGSPRGNAEAPPDDDIPF